MNSKVQKKLLAKGVLQIVKSFKRIILSSLFCYPFSSLQFIKDKSHINKLYFFSRSHLAKNGEPSEELISLSRSAMDAFASVHDIVHKVGPTGLPPTFIC